MNNFSTRDHAVLTAIRTLPTGTPMIVGLAESLKMTQREAGAAVVRLMRAGKIRAGMTGLYLAS